MRFLTRKIGFLPVWAYAVIVVIGGVVFYIWFKNYQANKNTANTVAQSTSGVAGANQNYNPLNPTGDPNIDPNTGVPYQLEEAVNPQTGAPYYYSPPQSGPVTTSPPTDQTTPTDTSTTPASTPSTPPPPAADTSTPPAVTAPTPSTTTLAATPPAASSTTPTPAPVDYTPAGGESIPAAGKYYIANVVGNTGQTNHLWNIAIQEYGANGTTQVNNATQAIINANPSLQGKSFTYQPPVGTRIFIPPTY